MKNIRELILIVLSSAILILFFVFSINFQKEIEQLKRDNIELQQKIIDFAEKINAAGMEEQKQSGEEEIKIDDVWVSYVDYELGFRIDYPKRDDYGVYQTMKMDNVVFIYDDSDDSVKKDLQKRSGHSFFDKPKGVPFALLTKNVNSDKELTDFIKGRYGDGCGVKEKKASNSPGIYNVSIGPDSGNYEDCFINWAVVIKYSPELKKVSAWDLGQAVNFVLDGEAIDMKIVDSFEFLR
jgi:hypothetical protein